MVDFVCVSDFERYAREHLPKSVRDYYFSGANGQQTLEENAAAFRRLRFRPRVLRDVSRVSTETTILGRRIAFPICAAPTAMQRMAHPDGEIATAKALAELGSCMTLSSWSTTSIEDVARSAPNGLRWFQLYVYSDRKATVDLIRRAESMGYEALALTVDTPVLGRRYDDVRNRFALPRPLRLENFLKKMEELSSGVQSQDDSGLAAYVAKLIDPSLNWETVAWLMSVTRLPIVLKGVLTGEDARKAVELGVAGIWVSNHGARQLDGVPATIEVLPEIVRAVGGRAEVYIDGGIRYGTDVLKALALGARAVFVGRPILFGLTYKGTNGVKRVMEILRDEFRTAMALSGCASLKDISRALVAHESYFWSQL